MEALPRVGRWTARKPRLVVQEGGRLELPPQINGNRLRQRLLRVSANLPFDSFIIDRRGIRAASVVGMVDVGICQIEILPKVSSGSTVNESSQFLLNLLGASGLVPHASTLSGRVPIEKGGVLEPIIRAFAEDLWFRLLEGPPRRYAEQFGFSPVLRGRIVFEAMATRPIGNDQRLPVRYAPLQRDNQLSRLMLAVVGHLQGCTRSMQTRRTLQYCAALLGGFSPGPLTPEAVETVHLNRLETHWEPVLAFARALVSRRSPQVVSSGDFSFFSLLFSLDDLFEGALRKSLKIALKDTGLLLVNQSPAMYLLRSVENGSHVLPMRPDYLFVSGYESEKKLVGDAKWKRLDAESRSFGLKPADAYQLTAYMASHDVQKGVLFFPRDEWMSSKGELWHHRFALTGGTGTVTVAAVDIYGLVSKDHERQKKAIENLKNVVLRSLE
jgi:5-methylcytosine-specific restriction enzyme subunit McrC